jgi:hypothetical protein
MTECKYIYNRGLKKGEACGRKCDDGGVCSLHLKCKVKVPPTAEELEAKKERLRVARRKKTLMKQSEALGVKPEAFMDKFKGEEGFNAYVKPLKKDKDSAEIFATQPIRHVLDYGDEKQVSFVADFLKAYKKELRT